MSQFYLRFMLLGFLGIDGVTASFADTPQQQMSRMQRELKQAGEEMLETLDISYVYGGAQVGSPAMCNQCNICLETERPPPKERIKACPACSQCSIDCSHFTKMVYDRAGLGYSYSTTQQMLELSAPELERRYGLLPVGQSSRDSMPGDLLVYQGHVVILEELHDKGTGDVIHATGGKDLKGPGQGIQRQRFVQLDHFRGPLLRVLRHKRIERLRHARTDDLSRHPTGIDLSRLRKVEKSE